MAIYHGLETVPVHYGYPPSKLDDAFIGLEIKLRSAGSLTEEDDDKNNSSAFLKESLKSFLKA